MVARKKVTALVEVEGSAYFPPLKSVTFLHSGCTLLDCVLGGGWALGRVANIVGDKSTGKTLLAIEATANFARSFPKGKIWYREAEAAFDEEYAASLGLPTKRVDFGPEGIGTQWNTIEDIFEDLDKELTALPDDVPGLYIIDSLDALSSRAELKRDVEKGTFGLEKQKMLGNLFRQLIRILGKKKVLVIFISQIRDKIGVTFGEKYTRSGGKSLDFYATHVLWLAHLERITRTVKGVKRATGVRVKAQCKKNKVGLPFRDCEFGLEFGYGILDVEASLDWLEEVKAVDRLNLEGAKLETWLEAYYLAAGTDRRVFEDRARAAVLAAWQEVEGRFAPTRRKYE